MNEMLNVVVVLARCVRSKEHFGIRLEEKEEDKWVADWAFAVKERYAKKEGYDKEEIMGVFAIDAVYPGCPHCQSKLLVKCGCGRVACWDGEKRLITCPWCGAKSEIAGVVDRLSAMEDI